MNNVIVTLKIYKGKAAYDEKQNLISENQLMKLKYGVLEWVNFMKSIKHLGISKVEIVRCTDGNKKDYPEIETPREILLDVAKCLVHETAKAETPDQKRIRELEAKIELIANGQSKAPVEKTEVTEEIVIGEDNSDIDQLRIQYEELYGEKPHQRMGVKKMNQKIAKKLV